MAIDVKYVAHLARLALTPEEEQRIGAQLGQVLDYIEKLKEVDVTGVDVLELRVECPGDYTNAQAVWVEPRVLQKQ